MAKLYFRYGAMNSGKSTGLLQTAYNYEECGQKVIVIKAAIDTKGADTVVSRLGVSRKVDVLAHAHDNIRQLVYSVAAQMVGDLEPVIPDPVVPTCDTQHAQSLPEGSALKDRVDCVLVDEAQFLSEEQVNQLMQIVLLDDIPVLAYGLRGDYKTQSFTGSKRLLEIAHSIEELKTICRCGRKAIFNARKINGDYVFSGEQIVIDDSSEVAYEALCGKCYLAAGGSLS